MRSRGRSGRSSPGDGVVPLIYFCASRTVLGAAAEVEAMAVHAGQVEDGLMLLAELDQRWGEAGELAALVRQPVGARTTVSWDTVLLLAISRPPGLEVELVAQQVRRVGPVELPSLPVRRALAVELVVRELTDAGCAAAAVAIGDQLRITDSPVAAPFRLRAASGSTPVPYSAGRSAPV